MAVQLNLIIFHKVSSLVVLFTMLNILVYGINLVHAIHDFSEEICRYQ